MLMAKACKTIKKYYMDCQCYILIKHIYSVCRFKQEILKRRISPNDGPSKNLCGVIRFGQTISN